MILRRVEIAGFKSFAKRTRIELGTDFCAIVGPNGSGKSNIADAIRWVFGEQKNRVLRTKKNEDVIFNGSDGRARSSMAEVTLAIDNNSGELPIDFSEIEITRQAYRSGESNYLLNGKSITVTYLHELLAKAGFGIGSYTVIGQGMIDQLILASQQDRKLMFEQASGIKQYEIKLAQTKTKLSSALDNITKLDWQINQLMPEQNQLQKQTEVLDRQAELKKRITALKGQYLYVNQREHDKTLRLVKIKMDKLKNELNSNQHALVLIERQQVKARNRHVEANKKIKTLRQELVQVERRRDEVIANISKLSVNLESSSLLVRGSSNTPKTIESRLTELKINLNQTQKKVKSLEKIIAQYETQIVRLDKKLQEKTHTLNTIHQMLAKSQKKEYLNHAIGLLSLLQKNLARPDRENETKIVFYKLHHMLVSARNDNAGELALQVGRLQTSISHILADREEVVEKQTGQVIQLRSLELDISNFTNQQHELRGQLKQLTKDTRVVTDCNNPKNLIRLKLEKTELDTKHTKLRNELYSLSDSGEQQESQKYASDHEQTTNKRVLLQTQLDQLVLQQKAIEDSIVALRALQTRWLVSVKPAPNVDSSLATLENIQKLEAEIALLDEVSPQVQARLTEVTTELEQMYKQKKDVSTATKNLQDAIVAISAKMQNVFEKNFALINTQFQSYFRDLFGGGSAKLSLVHGGQNDYGVEIEVQLPHKKNQALASLSGGEKALASVALLSGILSANPSPFVVLDEVDAALDEQNTQRFAKILRRLANKSQILVITHNHDTMALADELIGVTTSPKGDSQILRVALSEAFELPNAK